MIRWICSATRVATLCLAWLGFLAVTSTAQAGPPLLCHPIKIENAKSLPWGGDAFTVSKDYDRDHVVQDTLELLGTDVPVLVRMETLRRATIYLDKDQSKADQLFGALLSRTLDAEVVMDPKVLAMRYFDAGYFAATLNQAGVRTSFGPGVTKGDVATAVPGYAWAVRAFKLADGKNGDIALGLALMTIDTRMSEKQMFIELAVKAAPPDDAARNDLLKWIAEIQGTTLESLRAKVAATDARAER